MNRVPPDVDLFGEDVRDPVRLSFGAYPYKPGSGPSGERCGTCAHCHLSPRRNPRLRPYKCDLVVETFETGTDIRLKSPACWAWRARA